MRRVLGSTGVVLVVAIVANACVLLARSPARLVDGDAIFYLGIAQQLAHGRGYVDPGNYWPTTPTMGRAPGWPFVVSLSLRLFPSANPVVVMRVTAAVFNVADAIIIGAITLLAFGTVGGGARRGRCVCDFPERALPHRRRPFRDPLRVPRRPRLHRPAVSGRACLGGMAQHRLRRARTSSCFQSFSPVPSSCDGARSPISARGEAPSS